MKLIELHILQSFPVSCLNRDDVGSPKSAVFGGVTRARISSQCLKRASRLMAREIHSSKSFEGIRSRLLFLPFKEALEGESIEPEKAARLAEDLCKLFSKPDSKHLDQVTTAVYLSPGEIEQIAKAIATGVEAKKAIKTATRTDAADIALFGRMVANDPNLNIEGASMFSHALSTHQANNEVDFFSAVDDRKQGAEDAGAGMIGSLEFNSATYYRYVAINLDLLAEQSHLGRLSEEERNAILRSFIKAVLAAVPGARKNSMNAGTLPHEVIGISKKKGQPLQLINAFEPPVSNQESRGRGFAQISLEKMEAHLKEIEGVWGEQGEKYWLTKSGLDTFTNELLKD